MLTGKCCFLCGIALIFVSLLVLNLLTGAGAYIKHERDLYALSAVYQIYCTVVTFEVWLQWEISIGYYTLATHRARGPNARGHGACIPDIL